MISKEFINYISVETDIVRKDLIEKDLILQQLLKKLQNNVYFRENFVFKGGTCLVKCYLGYYRFSEDLDFTWINQTLFKNRSEKKIRRVLSEEINKILELLENIAKELSLDFKPEKENRNYVEFGGSNRFVTFKMWYDSQSLGKKQFIKVQINFVDLFEYGFKKLLVKNIVSKINLKDATFLFPEETSIIKEKVEIKAYDLKEILLEKSRAIMTRKGTKVRDFVDLYFITTHLKDNIEEYKEKIVRKTVFMFKYEKYKINFLNRKFFSEINMQEVENLLLKHTTKEFSKFIKDIIVFFNELIRVINKKIKLER